MLTVSFFGGKEETDGYGVLCKAASFLHRLIAASDVKLSMFCFTKDICLWVSGQPKAALQGRSGGSGEGRKAFVKNSKDGEWQVDYHGSCSSSLFWLQAYHNTLVLSVLWTFLHHTGIQLSLFYEGNKRDISCFSFEKHLCRFTWDAELKIRLVNKSKVWKRFVFLQFLSLKTQVLNTASSKFKALIKN